jgi:hypothetical protein
MSKVFETEVNRASIWKTIEENAKANAEKTVKLLTTVTNSNGVVRTVSSYAVKGVYRGNSY